jgi:hypothetical protein
LVSAAVGSCCSACPFCCAAAAPSPASTAMGALQPLIEQP